MHMLLKGSYGATEGKAVHHTIIVEKLNYLVVRFIVVSGLANVDDAPTNGHFGGLITQEVNSWSTTTTQQYDTEQ